MTARSGIPRRFRSPLTIQSRSEGLQRSYSPHTARATNFCTYGSKTPPPSFNFRDENMDLEKEIERVAQQYRDEGYVVVTHPDADHLPGFAADLGADILAARGNEKALIQVKKTRADVEADPTISRRAKVIGKQPGWRYDLIVLNEGDAFRRITRGAREPSE